MRSQPSHRLREQRMSFGVPRQLPSSPQRFLRYWPLDLDVHNRRLSELRNNPSERWFRYLRSLPSRKLATSAAAAGAERLWVILKEELETVAPPNASPTDDGGVLMSWTHDGHHVEIEFTPAGTYEWFYRHRISDTTDGGATDDETLNPRLVQYLKRVVD